MQFTKLVFLIYLSIGLNSIPAIARVMDGGNSGGGGNLNPAIMADAHRIDSFVRSYLPQLLKLYINYGYVSSDDNGIRRFAGIRHTDQEQDRLSISVGKKLYDGASNVFSKLSSIQILSQREDCVDPKTGEKKDGSAFGNTICISYGRLANRYTMNEYQKTILALAAHELSHLLGTTEAEAEYLESATLSIVKLDSWTSNHLSSRFFDIRIQLKDINEKIVMLLENQNLSPVAVCLRLQKIRTMVLDLKERTFNFEQIYGLSLMDPNQKRNIWNVVWKSVNITSFCKSTSVGHDFEFNEVVDLFKGNESILDISEYISRVSPLLTGGWGGQANVRRLSDGNKAFLQIELHEIQSSLNEALSAVKQY